MLTFFFVSTDFGIEINFSRGLNAWQIRYAIKGNSGSSTGSKNPDLGDFFLKKMEISGKKMRWLESYPKSEFIPIVFGRNSVDVVTKKRNLEVRDVAFERFTLYLIPVYSRPT